MTTIQASPKALTPEDATQKLMRMRIEANARHKSALRRNQKKLIEREPWLQEAIQEIVVYTARRRKLEERGILPKRTNETTDGAWTGVHAARKAKARLEDQANPLAGKQEARDDRPTPERLAKGDVGQHIIPGEGRKFRTKSPVEHYSGQWPSHVEAAFTCFVFDSEVGEYGRVTINYGGTSGGVPGSRLGGLGNALDRQRDAHERYCWVRERLSPDALQTLDSLVLQIREDAHSMNLESFGQHLFPAIRDKATRRGISIGALRVAGDQLAMLYRKFAVLSYAPKTELRDITPVRQARREPGVD